MLVLFYDEVVYCKSSILGKMFGDNWQKFVNVWVLFVYMFIYFGKKIMFMGMEFFQWGEWDVWGDLEWYLFEFDVY